MSVQHLEGTVAVVTGAAQGIGRAIALRLAADGCTVVVADRNEPGAAAVAAECAGPAEAVPCALDVADPASVTTLAEFVGGRYGRVDGLVNNAAIFSTITMKPFWEITVEEWNALIDVNLRGPWLVTSALVPLLRESAGASVVNIGSDSVSEGRKGYLHYTASKGGVQGMTFSMSRELGEFGIRANTVSPGSIQTEIPRGTVTPEQVQGMVSARALHRLAEPSDLTSLVAFLLSDQSGFITGQTISVNGGSLHR
jgi:NAD(P)-dependent dehydrogenase (short-subunit alcohol dehydrogenase family)